MKKHIKPWLVLGAAFLLLLAGSTPAHSEGQKPKSLSIVHLGDSYSAGNGAGDYHGPADCRRSGRNWGAIFASWVNSQGIAASYQNRACSGGTIGDLFSSRTLPKQSAKGVSASSVEDAKAKLESSDACSTRAVGDDFLSVDYHLKKNNSWWPWAKDYTYECQITIRAQADFVGPQTDLVLMTMGGNDLGFSHLVANCFGPKVPFVMDGAHAVKCRDDIAAAKSNLPSTLDKLKANISQLITTRMTGSTTSKVMLLSYPLLSTDRAYVLNNDGVRFDASHGIRELGQLAITEQKRIIGELEATFPGRVKFVEDAPAAFAGHEPDPRVLTKNNSRWLNEFLETEGDYGSDNKVKGNFSATPSDWYHPNLIGHREMSKLTQTASNTTSAQEIGARRGNVDMAFVINASSPLSTQIDQVRTAVSSATEKVASETSSARFALIATDATGQHRVVQPFTADTTTFLDAVTKLDPAQAATGSAEESTTSLDWRSGVRRTTVMVGGASSVEESRSKNIVPKADAGSTTQVLTIDTAAGASPQEASGSQGAETSTLTVADGTELEATTTAKVDALLDAPVATLQGPYMGKIGEELALDARGSYAFDGQVTQFEWDFDGDGNYDETTATGSTTHAYTDAVNNGFAKVRVTDSNGRQSVASARLDVTQDGDTVPDEFDNCPAVSNPQQEDIDHNGVGDACQESDTWNAEEPQGAAEDQASTDPSDSSSSAPASSDPAEQPATPVSLAPEVPAQGRSMTPNHPGLPRTGA